MDEVSSTRSLGLASNRQPIKVEQTFKWTDKILISKAEDTEMSGVNVLSSQADRNRFLF